MISLQAWLRRGWPFLIWFLFINILFFLPGSTLPHDDWMSKLHVDKFVHIGFFFMAVILWRMYAPLRPGTIVLLATCLLYGLLVEFVQRSWVPNRDFDLYDVVADMSGAVLACIVWGLYKKNKPL